MIIEGVCEHCGNREQDTDECALSGCPHRGAANEDAAQKEGEGLGEAESQTKGEAPDPA